MSNENMNTEPTIATLLTRMNEWGEKLTNEQAAIRSEIGGLRNDNQGLRKDYQDLRTGMEGLRKDYQDLRTGMEGLRKDYQDLRTEMDGLRKDYQELRTDLNTGLRRIERKIEILNDNMLTTKADTRDLEVRVEKLESESVVKS